MARFRTTIKGYDKKEVEAYLHKTTEYHESKLRELEECIKRLKEENDYLYAKNTEYHRNEERVSSAIVKAMQVKSDLEGELRKKIALEEDRLKIFKTKWIAYARGINRSNADRVVKDVTAYINAFEHDFVRNAARELDLDCRQQTAAERSYLSEEARLNSLRKENAEEKMSAASLLSESAMEDGDAPFGFTED